MPLQHPWDYDRWHQTSASLGLLLCKLTQLLLSGYVADVDSEKRHLAAADLWVQDRLRCKDFMRVKVLGADNVADTLTKHVNRAVLCKRMQNIGLKQIAGRADLAPQTEAH